MKKTALSTIIACLLCFACEREDIFGEEKVKIRATYTDDFNGRNEAKPVVNRLVYLKEQNSDNFLYTTTTDDDGRAEFDLLKVGEFEIEVIDSMHGIPYIGSVFFKTDSLKNKEIDIHLSPDDSKVNGIRLTFVDSNGDRVPKLPLCLFQNETLADSMNCSYSIYSGTTNNFGEYLLLNIPPDEYFLDVRDTVSGIPVTIEKESITVEGKGITSRELLAF